MIIYEGNAAIKITSITADRLAIICWTQGSSHIEEVDTGEFLDVLVYVYETPQKNANYLISLINNNTDLISAELAPGSNGTGIVSDYPVVDGEMAVF
jgi:hypothetical protein